MTTSPTPASSPSAARRALIVIGYLAVFWGVLPTALWLLGAGVDAVLALAPLDAAWAVPLGTVVVVIGAAFCAWSMLTLSVRGRGLPISHLPPTRLVHQGPYRLFRHPIYVGFNVLWCGVGMLSLSVGRAAASTVVLFLLWQGYARFIEEPALRRRFGAE